MTELTVEERLENLEKLALLLKNNFTGKLYLIDDNLANEIKGINISKKNESIPPFNEETEAYNFIQIIKNIRTYLDFLEITITQNYNGDKFLLTNTDEYINKIINHSNELKDNYNRIIKSLGKEN